MTKPLPRIRQRQAVTAAIVAAEPVEQAAPPAPRVRSRIRDIAAAPIATKTAAPATTSIAVERTYSDGRAPEVERNVQQFPVDIPTVHGTVNVGGKISLQASPECWTSVTVGLWMPCAPNEDAMEQTYKAASEWVERRLMRELAIAKGEYQE